MNKPFYTSVQTLGNNILYRGVLDGRRIKSKIEYQPSLYERTSAPTEFTNLKGEYLRKMKFDGLRDAREYVRQFEEVSGKVIYGNSKFEYAYIAEEFPGPVEWNFSEILIGIIDLEVGSENGFPDPYLANEPITAICLTYLNGQTYVFGCGEYTPKGNERYMQCKDEYTMLKMFLKLWIEYCPDVITGWNTQFFDIPYIINRMRKLLGPTEANKLSPWNKISEREIIMMGRKQTVYDIVGIGQLDYLELYRWYAPKGKSQESYKLGAIATVELGEKKISFDDYDNLHDLYKRNFQLFIEYNIQDVNLIVRMEAKLKLLELGLTLAYDTKCNYGDVFAQTRMWDALTYNYLLERNIIVPPKVMKEKDAAFEGAYVKEPQIGMHKWVASFDLDSLYPHLIMQYNISPETLIEPEDYMDWMRDVISQGISVDSLLAQTPKLTGMIDCTITPNGQFFSTEKMGFLPAMMRALYEDRKKFKKEMLVASQEFEVETDPEKKRLLEMKIARLNNLQLAKKLSLNSAYGALGSQYFRFFDIRMALAVTTAGQLSIRWIENKINIYMNKLLSTDGVDYVIASDTDSIYLRLGPLVDKVYGVDGVVKLPATKIIDFMDRVCKEKINPFLDKSFGELARYMCAYEQKMRMKREGLSDKGVWTAKKRYILNVYDNEGVRYHEPHMKVMGLEMIKSSTPSAVRDKMTEAVKIIMGGTESQMWDFIERTRTDFKKLQPEEVAFPRGINGLREYASQTSIYQKGCPIHVKGALLYNHYLAERNLTKKYQAIQDGEKIKFTYLKMPNLIKDTVISFPGRMPPEFGLEEFVDYDTQFEKTFLDPLKIILDCIDWTAEKTYSLWD